MGNSRAQKLTLSKDGVLGKLVGMSSKMMVFRSAITISERDLGAQ